MFLVEEKISPGISPLPDEFLGYEVLIIVSVINTGKSLRIARILILIAKAEKCLRIAQCNASSTQLDA